MSGSFGQIRLRAEERSEQEQSDAERRAAVEVARAAKAAGCTTWRSRFLTDLGAQRYPVCGSADVAGIMYGLPEYTAELTAELDAGRVFLGGCTMFDDDTVWCAGSARARGAGCSPRPQTPN